MSGMDNADNTGNRATGPEGYPALKHLGERPNPNQGGLLNLDFYGLLKCIVFAPVTVALIYLGSFIASKIYKITDNIVNTVSEKTIKTFNQNEFVEGIDYIYPAMSQFRAAHHEGDWILKQGNDRKVYAHNRKLRKSSWKHLKSNYIQNATENPTVLGYRGVIVEVVSATEFKKNGEAVRYHYYSSLFDFNSRGEFIDRVDGTYFWNIVNQKYEKMDNAKPSENGSWVVILQETIYAPAGWNPIKVDHPQSYLYQKEKKNNNYNFAARQIEKRIALRDCRMPQKPIVMKQFSLPRRMF